MYTYTSILQYEEVWFPVNLPLSADEICSKKQCAFVIHVAGKTAVSIWRWIDEFIDRLLKK